MRIETLGKKENPVIIMIPGMFCTSEMTAKIGKYFEKDYYVVLPTLDGHYEQNPHYISKQQDSKEMLEWIHENDIHEIEKVTDMVDFRFRTRMSMQNTYES